MQTTKEDDSNHHRPDRSFRGDIFLYILAKMVGSFSYNVQPAPDFLFQPPPKPTPCSHPVAQARGLTVQIPLASGAVPYQPPCSAAPSPASSSSGSSGWNSPTASFSFLRSSFESTDAAEEPTDLAVSVEAITSPPAVVPAPVTVSAPFGRLPEVPAPSRRRAGHGHSRQVSVTDCYADWAAEWSSDKYVVPGAWDVRDAKTAVTPAPATITSPPDVENKKGDEKPVDRKLRDDLWENDGVVAVYSQTHPLECSDAHCRHHGDLDLSAVTCSTRAHTTPRIGKLEDGIWHVFKSWGLTHNSLVGGLARYEAQRLAIWTKISEALLDLDIARAATR